MEKSIRERILDPNDFKIPYVNKGSQCFYCEKEDVRGIEVEDFTGNARHMCFDCVLELIELYKKSRKTEETGDYSSEKNG